MFPVDKNSQRTNLNPKLVRARSEIVPQSQPDLGSEPDQRPAETPALDPELARIFEASWKQNEEAYRFLGR